MSEHPEPIHSAFFSAMAVVIIAAVYPAWRAASSTRWKSFAGLIEATRHGTAGRNRGALT